MAIDRVIPVKIKFYLYHMKRSGVQAYGNVNMTDEEAEEMIMSADGDGNGEVSIFTNH